MINNEIKKQRAMFSIMAGLFLLHFAVLVIPKKKSYFIQDGFEAIQPATAVRVVGEQFDA